MNLRWTGAAIVAVLFALAQILPGCGLPFGQAATNLLTGSGPAGESVGIALAARRSKDEKDKKDDNRNDNKHDNGDDDENGNSNQDDSHEDAENVDAYENADNAPAEGQSGGEPEQAATPTPTSGPSSAASTAPPTAPSSAGGEPAPTPTLISPAAAAAPAAASTRQRPTAAPTPTTDAAAQPTPTSAESSGTAPSPSLTPTTEPMPTAGPPPTEPQVSGVANGSDLSVALGGDRVVVQVFPSMPTGTTIFVKRATKDQFPPVPGALVSDLIFVLEARDPSGGILLELPAQVNLIVHYQDADAGALTESRFTLSHLSLIDYSWRPTANQVKDAGANYVSAPISELGAYAVHVP